jgi:putative membrane protein
MKKKAIYSALISGITIWLIILSCKPQQNDDSKEIAKEHNPAKANNSREVKFLVEVTKISLREIELAKIVQESSASANIKEMGKTMERDHNEFLQEIKKLAKNKSISIPDGMTKNSIETTKKLEGKSGEDFDKQYCEIMVDGLKEEVKKFKSASEDIDDIDIKNWANKNLPALRNHLDHAMTCKESFKNQKNS